MNDTAQDVRVFIKNLFQMNQAEKRVAAIKSRIICCLAVCRTQAESAALLTFNGGEIELLTILPDIFDQC